MQATVNPESELSTLRENCRKIFQQDLSDTAIAVLRRQQVVGTPTEMQNYLCALTDNSRFLLRQNFSQLMCLDSFTAVVVEARQFVPFSDVTRKDRYLPHPDLPYCYINFWNNLSLFKFNLTLREFKREYAPQLMSIDRDYYECNRNPRFRCCLFGHRQYTQLLGYVPEGFIPRVTDERFEWLYLTDPQLSPADYATLSKLEYVYPKSLK